MITFPSQPLVYCNAERLSGCRFSSGIYFWVAIRLRGIMIPKLTAFSPHYNLREPDAPATGCTVYCMCFWHIIPVYTVHVLQKLYVVTALGDVQCCCAFDKSVFCASVGNPLINNWPELTYYLHVLIFRHPQTPRNTLHPHDWEPWSVYIQGWW